MISLAGTIRYLVKVATEATIFNFMQWIVGKEKYVKKGTTAQELIRNLKIPSEHLQVVMGKNDAPEYLRKITGKKSLKVSEANKVYDDFLKDMRAPASKEPSKKEESPEGPTDKSDSGKSMEVKEYTVEQADPKGKKPDPNKVISQNLKRIMTLGDIVPVEMGGREMGRSEVKVNFKNSDLGIDILKDLWKSGVARIKFSGPGSLWVNYKGMQVLGYSSVSDVLRRRASMMIDAGIIEKFRDFVKNLNEGLDEAMASKEEKLRIEEYMHKHPNLERELEGVIDLMDVRKSASLKDTLKSIYAGLKNAGVGSGLTELVEEAKKLLKDHEEFIKELQKRVRGIQEEELVEKK